MEESSGLSMLAKCEECGKTFTINKDVVVFKKDYEALGKRIFITYYDCPDCGKRHYVQIDDRESLEVLANVNIQMRSLMVLRAKNKNVPKKKTSTFEKTRTHLSEIRKELMMEFNEKKVYNINEGKYESLRFSV